MHRTEEPGPGSSPGESPIYYVFAALSAEEVAFFQWNGTELTIRRRPPEELLEWAVLLNGVKGTEGCWMQTPLGIAWVTGYRQRGSARALAVSPGTAAFGPEVQGQLVLLAQFALTQLQLKAARSQVQNARQEQDRTVRKERLHAQGQLIRAFVHDFNNLLATILLRAEMAPVECDNTACRESLHVICDKAGDGARILQQLEDFSGTRPSPDQDLVDVGQLVQTVAEQRWADMHGSSGRSLPLRLSVQAAEDLHVLASAADIREIIGHLLANAREAMPEGGEAVVQVSRDRKEAVIHVSDSGTGMTDEILAHAAEPFFSTKAAGHLGLGLSVVHGIVARSGGSLTVTSQPGTGTQVALTLPLANLKAVRRELRKKQEDAPELLRNLNVLVVDDEPSVRETVALSLESLGHRVTQAVDGRQAMGLVRYQEGFDVMVLDLVMPDLDGWQVAYLARKLQPQTAIILLTGWGEKIREDDDGRVDAVLAKPVTIKELNHTLSRVVARQRQRAERAVSGH